MWLRKILITKFCNDIRGGYRYFSRDVKFKTRLSRISSHFLVKQLQLSKSKTEGKSRMVAISDKTIFGTTNQSTKFESMKAWYWSQILNELQSGHYGEIVSSICITKVNLSQDLKEFSVYWKSCGDTTRDNVIKAALIKLPRTLLADRLPSNASPAVEFVCDKTDSQEAVKLISEQKRMISNHSCDEVTYKPKIIHFISNLFGIERLDLLAKIRSPHSSTMTVFGAMDKSDSGSVFDPYRQGKSVKDYIRKR